MSKTLAMEDGHYVLIDDGDPRLQLKRTIRTLDAGETLSELQRMTEELLEQDTEPAEPNNNDNLQRLMDLSEVQVVIGLSILNKLDALLKALRE